MICWTCKRRESEKALPEEPAVSESPCPEWQMVGRFDLLSPAGQTAPERGVSTAGYRLGYRKSMIQVSLILITRR